MISNATYIKYIGITGDKVIFTQVIKYDTIKTGVLIDCIAKESRTLKERHNVQQVKSYLSDEFEYTEARKGMDIRQIREGSGIAVLGEI